MCPCMFPLSLSIKSMSLLSFSLTQHKIYVPTFFLPHSAWNLSPYFLSPSLNKSQKWKTPEIYVLTFTLSHSTCLSCDKYVLMLSHWFFHLHLYLQAQTECHSYIHVIHTLICYLVLSVSATLCHLMLSFSNSIFLEYISFTRTYTFTYICIERLYD